MPSHGADKWEVQGQLGHRGGVMERDAEYARDHRAKATAAIEAFWKKGQWVQSGDRPVDDVRQVLDCAVPVERIELPTFGLQNRCSTAELNRRCGNS
jgi:hypothetical protein